MADGKKDVRKPEPWEYPYSFDDDPGAEADRRTLNGKAAAPEGSLERAVSAYWQRHADHAEVWLQANPNADRKERDHALAYRVAAARNARTAGGLRSPPVHHDLERLFSETGNPLYFWQALATETTRPEPSQGPGSRLGSATIPGWCAQELTALARRLTALGRAGMPAVTEANIKAALGLTSQGFNAYAEREHQTRDGMKADFAAELVAAGMPPQRARSVAFPSIADARSLRRAAKRSKPRAKPPGEV